MNQVNCSVCGNAIPSDGKVVSEHKHAGKICYGSYTPINPVNPFKNPIPERHTYTPLGSTYVPWGGSASGNDFVDLSTVPNR